MCRVGCREGAEEQEGEEEVLIGVCGTGLVRYGGGGYGQGEVAVCGCETLGFVRNNLRMHEGDVMVWDGEFDISVRINQGNDVYDLIEDIQI